MHTARDPVITTANPQALAQFQARLDQPPQPNTHLQTTMRTSTPLPPWPYPRWIAHRGAGKLAPENTLAAFRLGAHYGYRMAECDVKLSADGVPFLLHDDDLARTTNAATATAKEYASNMPFPHASRAQAAPDSIANTVDLAAGYWPWAALSQLDAGGWHSRSYAGEPLATLAGIAAFCLANGHALNIEIKPTPGDEAHTGTVVAQHAARLWHGVACPPLLSSFAVEAVQAAHAAAPHLPRALLLDTLWDGWLDAAQAMDCVAVVCNYRLCDAALVQTVHGAGMRALCYTVNDADAAHALLALGLDGLITDRVDYFSPLF